MWTFLKKKSSPVWRTFSIYGYLRFIAFRLHLRRDLPS